MKEMNGFLELDFKLITLLVLTISQVNNAHGKPNYEIVVEQVITYNEYNSITVNYARMQRFNTTTRALNASFTVNEELDKNTNVKIMGFQQMPSGRYSMVPIKFMDINLCDAFKEKFIYPQVLRSSNFPAVCPFAKGEYWLNNFVPDTSRMPDKLPGDRWKAVWTDTVGGKLVFRTDIVFLIDRDSVF